MGATTTANKIAHEVAAALVAAYLADSEKSFGELCEEAGIDPEDVEELKPC